MRWTWAELDGRASAVGAALVRAGGVPGSAVALLADPSAASVAFVHGIARSGGVLVPLGTRLTAPELVAALAETGAGLLVHDAAHAGLAAEVAGAAGSAEVARASVSGPLAILPAGGPRRG